jgi:hypothetical protein
LTEETIATTGILLALVAALLIVHNGVSYAQPIHDSAHSCWEELETDDLRVCAETYRTATTTLSDDDEVAGVSIAELAAQIRRALDHAPGATCELKIYSSGAVTVCE